MIYSLKDNGKGRFTHSWESNDHRTPVSVFSKNMPKVNERSFVTFADYLYEKHKLDR
jgi:hypothetical protein